MPDELRIVEDLPRENAFGDDLDARRARHFRAEAHAIADRLADLLAERLRHALGAGARRDPPRLEHEDLLARQPRLVQQRQRHARGLAGAGRRDQDGGIGFLQRAGELVEHVVDRQRRIELRSCAAYPLARIGGRGGGGTNGVR